MLNRIKTMEESTDQNNAMARRKAYPIMKYVFGVRELSLELESFSIWLNRT